MPTVVYSKFADGIAQITLNDPDSLNAMSEGMADEFRALVASIAKDPVRPRVIILTGAGRAFSAGGDLEMLKRKTTLSKSENEKLMLKFYESFLSILDLDIPLIAAINGHAIGAGLCVACACDIRIAASGAKLGFTFVKLGLHPGMGATYFLPDVLGAAAARELMLTGRVVEAAEAERLGLVSKTVPGDQVLNHAGEIAAEIASNGPLAVAQLVRSLRSPAQDLKSALAREALCQSENYKSAEFLEGVQAAIEKRKARFN